MNLLNLCVKLFVDDSDVDKKFEKTGNQAEALAGKLKNGLAAAAKVGSLAVSAAATGISVLTKKSIESYGEYEQLVGGVETLFKQSADAVMGYAENAYKTAGMSANEYMTTVTAFSASLLQSMGGDTDAAAEKANLAITDMSDNANKMGTDMELIQNAYRGFRFLYNGIIIKHQKTEPTYTKTSLFLCEKRRFFMARREKGVVPIIYFEKERGKSF